MKKNCIVNSLWIDPVLGDLQKICLNSFISNGVFVNLYTYGDLKNVPEGIHLKDARDIIPQAYVFKDCNDSYATFSDWFRIKLLHKTGGWWVDSDVFCIRPFEIIAPYIFATERHQIDGVVYNQICNAVIKMPSRTRFGRTVIQKIEDRLMIENKKNIYWTEIGAVILQETIEELGLQDYIVKPEVFCPTDFQQFEHLAKLSVSDLSEFTYGVHLWNKMWEWSNKDLISDSISGSIINK